MMLVVVVVVVVLDTNGVIRGLLSENRRGWNHHLIGLVKSLSGRLG
jgi:hypothetical protein